MIIVTAATGQLGRLVITSLLESGTPADRIVAGARTPSKAADLAARGVSVREVDYDRPETLAAAFAGAEKVLLISGSEMGRRVPQHQAAVDAAVAAGVSLLAYTSAPHADNTPLSLAAEHKATEEYISAAGVPHVVLRNGWYLENYVPAITQAAATGVIIGTAGDGRISSALCEEFAAAAAAVLRGEGEAGRTYELAGDEAWTMSELAAAVSRRLGRDVVYRDLPVEELRAELEKSGLPGPMAEMLAGIDVAIGQGALEEHSGDLSALIGRPTRRLDDALATLKL